jgi:hypothetical protein
MAFLERIRPQEWGPEIWRTYDPAGASFFNLNQPADLARLEAWAAGRQENQAPAAH